MDKQTISTSLAPEIAVEFVMGNLQVKGWDRPEVSVRANPEDLSLTEQDDTVQMSCRGNCMLYLPQGATLHVDKIHGEARFKLLEDQLTIGEAHGPVTLRHVAETSIQRCQGDLFAKYISGDLRADQVQGNAYIREVQGTCVIDDIAGNLDIRSVESDIKASARGNARVRLPYLGGKSYQIEAQGNAHIRIPSDASLNLHLECGSGNMSLKIPDQPRQLQTRELDLVLGVGETEMTISARGNLYLAQDGAGDHDRDLGDDIGFDFSEEFGGISDHFGEHIAQQIETQIESQMEALSQQLNAQMEKLASSMGKSGLSEEEIEQIMARTREESERATARAQERMRRAQEKMEKKLEAARRRTEQKAQAAERRSQSRKRSWNFEWAKPQPAPEKSPVSDEERLMILRMLEQKKISLEEAEQLLSALES